MSTRDLFGDEPDDDEDEVLPNDRDRERGRAWIRSIRDEHHLHHADLSARAQSTDADEGEQ